MAPADEAAAGAEAIRPTPAEDAARGAEASHRPAHVRAFAVETIHLDLPALAGAFSRRLHAAGLPVTAERATAFAEALTLVRPITRRRLYWTARAVFLTDLAQSKAFDVAFSAVFGHPQGGLGAQELPRSDDQAAARQAPAPPDERPSHAREGTERRPGAAPPRPDVAQSPPTTPGADRAEPTHDVQVPTSPSDEEMLREKRFDALQPAELAQLYRLMTRLALATPTRLTRRAQRHPRGRAIDLRRTLRQSMRTGGDPIRLARRRRRTDPRRLVLLCDISGSMEPYARAYLQFLTCAAGAAAGVGAGAAVGAGAGATRGAGARSGARRGGRRRGQAEAFVFATRLTRVTRALASRNPERAIQQAAAAAPDWSSGTRIGDALKTFNDRHGRRGMARGAVVVILSDGWERGDPALVGREMERLARLAHRIVWVNPRAAASGFEPRAGGMRAALPYCDALLSGHNLAGLERVAHAIADERAALPALEVAPQPPDEEPWASATPAAGSSVAMPSGYGPSRGRTTPGWVRP